MHKPGRYCESAIGAGATAVKLIKIVWSRPLVRVIPKLGQMTEKGILIVDLRDNKIGYRNTNIDCQGYRDRISQYQKRILQYQDREYTRVIKIGNSIGNQL